MNNQTVLVTGGSGFLGAHCILQLLESGYTVRTTVRSLEREGEVRAMLKTGGAGTADLLSFFAADLMADRGWQEAVAGCAYVLHVASPFPSGAPKHEDELIVPAREGALRVLRAAREAGVGRVVLTSSFAAVGYSSKPEGEVYTEEDWTNPEDEDIGAYVKSKTIAERAAWDFIASEGGSLELTVINPVGIFGPVLGLDYSASIQIIKRLLDGDMSGGPGSSFGVVDVRDVAALHLKAMTNPAANGERFLAVAGKSVTMTEIAQILRDKLAAPVNIPPGEKLPEPGETKVISHEKAKRVLEWKPRSNEEALVATAESLMQLGLVAR